MTVGGMESPQCLIEGVRLGYSLSSWIGHYGYKSNRSEEALYSIAVQSGLTVSTLNCLVVV